MAGDSASNLWSNEYDSLMRVHDSDSGYPFEGRKKLLAAVYSEICRRPGKHILDLGPGYFLIARKLCSEGYAVTAVENSDARIHMARRTMPGLEIVDENPERGFPACLRDRKFDIIISVYMLHRICAARQYAFIEDCLARLCPDGALIVGDVIFETRMELEKAHEKFRQTWYENDSYLVLGEIGKRFAGILSKTQKTSFCGEMLVLEPGKRQDGRRAGEP